jgi:glycosyltransferase involved in cell wall biosynthesis
MIKLSAAMIVKNEEKNLERCLRSIKPFVDEIVIVDTGSTDRTVEIAKKFTDKIFHQPWEDNFSKHRNYSFSLATGDWIFQIDADEELIVEEGFDLRTMLEEIKDEINVVALKLRDWSDRIKTFAGETEIIRIFRNGKVTFKRRIHNEPVFEGVAGYTARCWIKHYGYNLTAEERKAKAKRTIGLLEQSIAEDPDDIESLFYLSQAHLVFGDDSEKALEYAIKYYENKDKLGTRFNRSTIHLIASVLTRKQDFKQAMQYIEAGLKENPIDIDLNYDLMNLGIAMANNQMVLVGASQYLNSMSAYQKGKGATGIIGNQFYFHIDPHSYAAATYWFSILHIEIGISRLRLLAKYTRENCNEKVVEEIESRKREDFAKLSLEDKTESRLIMPGILNGNTGHRAVGARR